MRRYEKGGFSAFALIPETHRCGNRKMRWCHRAEALMTRVIELYASTQRPSKTQAVADALRLFESENERRADAGQPPMRHGWLSLLSTDHRYASHNLRFKLNRADENEAQFLARISKAAEQPDEPESDEQDGWVLGSNRRDVGSLHIDQLTCRASDLAQRNLIAVHPVTGWWKAKPRLQDKLPIVRYSLIIEIDAEELECDLHAEVAATIEAMTAVGMTVAV